MSFLMSGQEWQCETMQSMYSNMFFVEWPLKEINLSNFGKVIPSATWFDTRLRNIRSQNQGQLNQ